MSSLWVAYDPQASEMAEQAIHRLLIQQVALLQVAWLYKKHISIYISIIEVQAKQNLLKLIAFPTLSLTLSFKQNKQLQLFEEHHHHWIKRFLIETICLIDTLLNHCNPFGVQTPRYAQMIWAQTKAVWSSHCVMQ